jgi:hypothetical protein
LATSQLQLFGHGGRQMVQVLRIGAMNMVRTRLSRGCSVGNLAAHSYRMFRRTYDGAVCTRERQKRQSRSGE